MMWKDLPLKLCVTTVKIKFNKSMDTFIKYLQYIKWYIL